MDNKHRAIVSRGRFLFGGNISAPCLVMLVTSAVNFCFICNSLGRF